MRMIFEDPSRRRSRLAVAALIVLVLAAALLAIDLSLAAFHPPELPAVSLERSADTHRFVYAADARGPTTPTNAAPPAPTPSARAPLAALDLAKLAWIRAGFVVQDDPMSVKALAARSADLDVILPDTFSFARADGSFRENLNAGAMALIKASGAACLPRLSNTDAKGEWRPDAVVALLKRPEARATLIAGVADRVRAIGAAGINLDLESLPPEVRDPLSDFVHEFTKAMHDRGLILTIDLPINESAYDYELLGATADYTVLMAYDQCFGGGEPGPVAGHDWFADGVTDGAKRIPPDRLLAGIGAYGYDWDLSKLKDGKGPAEAVTFDEAMMIAADADADVETDPQWRHPYFKYEDAARHAHVLWLLDATTAYNQARVAARAKTRGVAVWRLGTEDPAAWNAMDRARSDVAGGPTGGPMGGPKGGLVGRPIAESLARVEPLEQVVYVNEGEFYQVTAVPGSGTRTVAVDAEGYVEYAHYDTLPTACVVTKTGAVVNPAGQAGQVALTFDDGPDPAWTPRILDVLRASDVPAAFFVVGSLVEVYPEIARRIIAEGHTIGNHSYLHPDLTRIALARVPVEVNAAERAIEAATGHQTVLFRAPYDADCDPTDTAGLRPMHVVNRMGYLTVGAAIDSEDFRTPGTPAIVRNVLDGLAKRRGGVIVMHDAGGDRSQTVEALRELIPAVRQAGYRFVGLSDLLNKDVTEVNPPVPASEHVIIAGTRVWSWLATTGWGVIRVLFAVTTLVALLRIAFLGSVVLRSHRRTARERGVPSEGVVPEATLLIPAYNEERVIERTVRAVLATTDGHVRVLVIDDGSTDGTADRVEAIAATTPRVRLIRQANAGKAVALNRGLREAQTDAVITIDADTLILPGTIRALLAPLADPAVDAVCGNVQVGNVRNLLTACQDVEYVTSQNYDRRAFDSLNCINVVPGATGAWRRGRVLDAGGYSGDTLTEDADLTLSLLRSGGRIVYADDARSVTEAPETMRALFKQRFRWSFGTFQCLWKHRAALGRGTLGCIALPNVIVFQVLFPILSPIGDVVLLLSLIKGDLSAIAAGYLTFVLLDLIASVAAFRLDGRPLGRLWVVLVQRFFYRQFMYVVTLRAVWAALRGRRHGWNKLERRDSVVLEHSTTDAAEMVAE